MANNELSGPIIVATFLAKWLLGLKKRKYNYHFVFIPETIGSIIYIHQNLKALKNTKAGFVLSCIGDDLAYSLIHTPNANSLSDKVALHSLKNKPNFKAYSFLERGSDERQYNSPLINLGIVGICRSKYREFKEYHTSKDDLTFVTPSGLEGGFKAMQEILLNLELNEVYQSKVYCEPNLGKRGLYPTLNLANKRPLIADFIAYCDGKNDVIDIAEILGVKAYELEQIIKDLLKFKLIAKAKQ